VVIASWEDTHDPQRLIRLLRESGCTVMQATPATWRSMIQAGWTGSPKLKVLCGGEALLRDLADELLARCGELWNMYGPTETTVWSTVHKLTPGKGPVPIGKAIANTQLYVLNAQRNLVPQGATGELYIGGDGLAKGYLHREELTRERFVPSPFVPNALLYRTGDLARWLPGGIMECLGRADNQVKLRGFRIELGEIDSVLSQHPGVRQCASIVREDRGDKQLIAYFESQSGQTPTTADLRAHLEGQLPAYMIPSVFVAMDKLPLTPNGKIDRKSLPAPAQLSESDRDFVAPQDQLEQMLARIWSDVLKVKQVGRNDNFFELGGHSLLAVRIVAETEKLTNVRLPLAMLLQSPTIAELADQLRRKNWKPSWSSLVPIQSKGSKPPLFLVHAAEGNVLLYRTLASHLGADQPVYGLQSTGLDGKSAINGKFEVAAERYVSELRQFQPHGPYFLGGYCLGGSIALEMARQLTEAGETVAFVGMIESFNMCAVQFPLPAPQRFVNRFVLNPYFHFRNLMTASGADRWKFFREKLRVEVARVKVSLGMTWAKLTRSFAPNSSESQHLKVADIYEQGLAEYVTKLYPGEITVFQPTGHLAGLSDPSSGWEGVAQGGLQLVKLPNCPRASLVEPFVLELAKRMRGCLDSAARHPASASPRPSVELVKGR